MMAKQAKLQSQDGTVLANIILSIENEVADQAKKWGVQNHHPERWVSILTEEVGEVAKAANEANLKSLKTELQQVAAVCISALYALEAFKDEQDGD